MSGRHAEPHSGNATRAAPKIAQCRIVARTRNSLREGNRGTKKYFYNLTLSEFKSGASTGALWYLSSISFRTNRQTRFVPRLSVGSAGLF